MKGVVNSAPHRAAAALRCDLYDRREHAVQGLPGRERRSSAMGIAVSASTVRETAPAKWLGPLPSICFSFVFVARLFRGLSLH
jgi:hypothetical protein